MRNPYPSVEKTKLPVGMICAVLLVIFSFSKSALAECGGYVTIGNKAKAAELRAAGFDVGNEMTSHENKTFNKIKPSNHPDQSGFLKLRKSSLVQDMGIASTPIRLPCSGPNCKSNRKTTPIPQPVSLNISLSKSGIGLSKSPEYDRESSFSGFTSIDEKPSSLNASLDRPPE